MRFSSPESTGLVLVEAMAGALSVVWSWEEERLRKLLRESFSVKPTRKEESDVAPLRSGNPGRLGALKLEKYLFYVNLPVECINYLGGKCPFQISYLWICPNSKVPYALSLFGQ